MASGFVKFVFFPSVESDNIVADLTMPMETPAEVTAEAMRRLEQSATELENQVEAAAGRFALPAHADLDRRAAFPHAGQP